jgi:response regulator RpfG family c-di-GMP phosphodiesterase
MAHKVLFVDDELAVLDGYRRSLRGDFAVDIAEGGEQGLVSIRDRGPYAVVVSDMRMPSMNGAQFLAQVRQEAPDAVRMLLTGYTDLSAAMAAVNEGNIFRFLTKPCEKEVLTQALAAGLAQHNLIIAEKELLENTLMGSIKVLTEVLGAASPHAFGRSMRIARYVRHLVAKFKLSDPWRFEAAAMLSQLGCVTLDLDIIQRAYFGARLVPEDKARFASHPQVAKDLLSQIPRLEPIAWMVSQQLPAEGAPSGHDGPSPFGDVIALGAKILKLSVAMDTLRMQGLDEVHAIAKLRERRNEFGTALIDALAEIEPENARMEMRKVPIAKLRPGMILQQEITTKSGMLVVPQGQEVTQALLIKLENFSQIGTIGKEIMALVPMQ